MWKQRYRNGTQVRRKLPGALQTKGSDMIEISYTIVLKSKQKSEFNLEAKFKISVHGCILSNSKFCSHLYTISKFEQMSSRRIRDAKLNLILKLSMM